MLNLEHLRFFLLPCRPLPVKLLPISFFARNLSFQRRPLSRKGAPKNWAEFCLLEGPLSKGTAWSQAAIYFFVVVRPLQSPQRRQARTQSTTPKSTLKVLLCQLVASHSHFGAEAREPSLFRCAAQAFAKQAFSDFAFGSQSLVSATPATTAQKKCPKKLGRVFVYWKSP